MDGTVQRLYDAILAARLRDPAQSRTSKLFRDGIQKMANKLAEEALEVGIDAVQSRRDDMILESADLLYNLCVIWAATDITPDDVAEEINRREQLFGIAEKLPKTASPRKMRESFAITAPARPAGRPKGHRKI